MQQQSNTFCRSCLVCDLNPNKLNNADRTYAAFADVRCLLRVGKAGASAPETSSASDRASTYIVFFPSVPPMENQLGAHRTVHLVVSSFYPNMEIPLVRLRSCTINTTAFAFMDFFFLPFFSFFSSLSGTVCLCVMFLLAVTELYS